VVLPLHYFQSSGWQSFHGGTSERRDRLMVPDLMAYPRRAVVAGLPVLAITVVTAAGFATHNAAAPPTATQLQIDEIRHTYLTDQFNSGKAISSRQGTSGGSHAVLPSVTAVAFSPDDTLLAGAYSSGSIRLWDPATGHQHGPVLQAGPDGHSGMTAIAFSPDGTQLASAHGDGIIRLWNPATGQLIRSPLPAGSTVNAVAFSPDGKLLASADADGTVRVWNAATFRAADADGTEWFILLASLIALALSAFTVVVTAREIRLARSILG
jgi:WD domain, G-beta repeat